MPDKSVEASAWSPETVRAELDRILASPAFSQSESLKRFLRHVVEVKLSGRESELKEFSLGSEVFDRGESYDPRTDPIVRVQATRLRSKLRDYYHEAGQTGEVLITLPKGSYVPEFEGRGAPSSSGPVPRFRRTPYLAAAAIFALILVGALLLFRREAPDVGVPSNGAIRSLAVLPFTDMSPGGDHAYYGDGLAEEITTTLAGAPGLEVVPRMTAFQFRDGAVDLREVSTKLEADALLQGSVRRDDDRLRIQVQLIRSRDQQQIWAETYDRPATDAFRVQEEIARSVARAVRHELTGESPRPEHHVPAAGAYELYLRGRFKLERNTPLSIEQGIRLFEEALELDPDYAPAYAGLVDAYVLNVVWGFSAPEETRSAAREAAERALALGGEHPEPVAAAAAYELAYERDFEAAEAALERAAEEGPSLHVVAALIAIARGYHETARRDLVRARELAPRKPLVEHLLALVAFHSGELDEAREIARGLLDWAPAYPLAWHLLARIESARGDDAAARDALDAFEGLAGASAASTSTRAVTEALAGNEAAARERLGELESRRREGYVPATFVARVHAALGENDAALRELETASTASAFPLLFVGADPDYASLRREPRFRALLERLGLAVD